MRGTPREFAGAKPEVIYGPDEAVTTTERKDYDEDHEQVPGEFQGGQDWADGSAHLVAGCPKRSAILGECLVNTRRDEAGGPP